MVSKQGINVGTATDPNDFIFHSDYNTLKIVANGTLDFNMAAGATVIGSVAHGLSNTPMTTAFLRENSGTEVCGPNTRVRLGIVDGDFIFHDVSSDGTNNYFRVENVDVINAGTAHISWLSFEIPFN